MTVSKRPMGGVQAVVDMLAFMDKEHRDRLLTNVAERDPGLASQIREKLFTFEHLVDLDPKSVPVLVSELPRGKLILALRKVSEDLKSHIVSNISKRAADHLLEEVEALGAQKLTDVLAAQLDVAEIAKRLQDEGKIVFRNEDT